MKAKTYLKICKEPIKIATHASDLDGIGSAALLIRVCEMMDKNYDISFLSVDKAKRLDKAFDFVTDLPKIDRALNIDHHQSNLTNLQESGRLTEEDIVEVEVSAARLVYNYLYEDFFQTDKTAKEIEEISSQADQGKMPNRFREVDLLIKNYVNDPSKLLLICKKFSELGSGLADDPWIIKEYKTINKTIQDTKTTLRIFFDKYSEKMSDILLLDVVNAVNQKFAKEAISLAYYSDVKVLGIISYKEGPDIYSVSFRVENAFQNAIDVSQAAENLGGGGHTMAAGASGKDRIKLRNAVKRELVKIAQEQNMNLSMFILEEL